MFNDESALLLDGVEYPTHAQITWSIPADTGVPIRPLDTE